MDVDAGAPILHRQLEAQGLRGLFGLLIGEALSAWALRGARK
jgi:hypothetical protein